MLPPEATGLDSLGRLLEIHEFAPVAPNGFYQLRLVGLLYQDRDSKASMSHALAILGEAGASQRESLLNGGTSVMECSLQRGPSGTLFCCSYGIWQVWFYVPLAF